MTLEEKSAHELGREGELIACRYLEAKGYKILARGFRYQHWEIDIVALDGETLVFIEVKTRHHGRFGFPEEAVNTAKQARIRASASGWLASQAHKFQDCRFDILSITYQLGGPPEIVHLQDAF